MGLRKKRILERGSEQLLIDASEWADILLLALTWAWKPDSPAYNFLATNYEVTSQNARALADAIERIWGALSKDPFNVHLNPAVDVSLLMNVGAFCLRGSFVVR